MIVTLIPAAGASSRMRGRDKLLEAVGNDPILRRTALEALKADLGPVIVTLPPKAIDRRKALHSLDLRIVEVEDANEGMAASLRAGAREAMPLLLSAADTAGSEYHGMLVLLPDMPGPEGADLRDMYRRFQVGGGPIVRATDAAGRKGHPVLFPTHLVRSFEDLTGDQGAARVMQDERIVFHELEGDRATRDLDTPEDWAAWRGEH